MEKLFGMRMAGLCQFYWRTCFYIFLSIITCEIITMGDQVRYAYDSLATSAEVTWYSELKFYAHNVLYLAKFDDTLLFFVE